MATGIREGKARFGDDVRERARKAMEGRARMKERVEREPAVKAKPKAAAKPASKPAPKAAPKKMAPPARVNALQERADREPPARPKFASSVPTQPASQRSGASRTAPAAPAKKSTQMGPKMTFPRDVGTDKAAAARAKMFEGKSPLSDIMDAMRGKKGTGGQMSRMKKGGAVKKGYKK
jgi:hypothetical protein